MPVKIGFQLISCSGEDERYRAGELNYHGPTVRGWRSSPNARFPQEIILQLKSLVKLQQIQILAHQYLIPQKIEICTSSDIGCDNPSESSPDYFDYLGYITFSDNEATRFRSRELKSILIPSVKAKYIKLRIFRNHENIKNILNQVGLMGINVFGEEEEIEMNNNFSFPPTSAVSNSIPFNSKYISPYDDLAFEMYVDQETAKIIKIIENKKIQAVIEERFELANTLKTTLENLRAAGEIIGLYEQEKKQAVQFEDYDKAKFKKMQIDNFKQKVYEALKIDELLVENEFLGESNGNFNDEDRSAYSLEYSTIKQHRQNDVYYLKEESFKQQGNFHQQDALVHKQITSHEPFENQKNQLIHSRSQNSFSYHQEPVSSTSYKNRIFSTSTSNPQLHQYQKDDRLNYIRERSINGHSRFGYVVPPSSSSTSSDTDESVLITTSDSLRFSAHRIKQDQTLNEKASTSATLHENPEDKSDGLYPPQNLSRHETNVRLPPADHIPERNRTKISCEEQLKLRTKVVADKTIKTSFEAYEDRMLPALKNYHGNEVVRECQLALDQQIKTTLNEREKKQACLSISVFGIELIEKFYSKSFCDKEEGLKELQQELKKIINSSNQQEGDKIISHNRVARAAIFLLHRALRDKVYSVYSTAAETIRLFFTEFIPKRVSPPEIIRCVEKLLPELLTKSGDVTPRIHNMAAHTLLTMAECEDVRRLHIISSHLSRPITSSVHPRLALSRLEMVEQLILNHGISKDKRSGLTCRTLAEFGSSGLHHPAEAVRKVSERILLQVYRVNPRIVRKQLPPDDNVTRRNLLYRQLFREFDIMDEQTKSTVLEEFEQNEKTSTDSYLKHNRENNTHTNGFSINNIQENLRKNTPNLDFQLQTIKNFMSINLRDGKKSIALPHKESNKSPARNNKSTNSNTLTKGTQEMPVLECVSGTGNLRNKNTTVLNTRKIELKKQTNVKSPSLQGLNNTRKPSSGVSNLKFPSLTDSIDTTKARMILDQKKSIQQKKQSNKLTKDQPEHSVMSADCKLNKGEIKKSYNASSIPVPTFGSNRKYTTNNIIKKTNKDPTIYQKELKLNKKSECDGIVDDILYSFKNKKTLEKVETINKSKGGFQKRSGIPVDTYRYYFEKNIARNFNAKTEEKEKNRFSDSMLASIRENEVPETCIINGLNEANEVYKSCIFCLTSKNWTDEDSLNKHYLQDCPMLTSCEYCMEIIEIAGFTNHLLEECNQKHLFQKCTKCQQAILDDLRNNHDCTEFSNKKNASRCPFCHTDIGDEESSWRKHLMGTDVCPNHPRQLDRY